MAGEPNPAQPIDTQTGMYQDPGLLSSPGAGGVGSPIPGILAMINAARGAQLASQSDALRKQAEMEQVQKNAATTGGSFYDNPEGQGVLSTMGVSPETPGAMYSSSPQGRIRGAIQKWQTDNPGKQMSSSDIQQVYLDQGVPLPSGFYGYAGREAATSERWSAAQLRAFNLAADAGEKVYKDSRAAGDADDVAASKGLAAVSGRFGAVPEEYQGMLRDSWQKRLDASTGKQAPTVAAKIGQENAAATASKARAGYLDKIAGPMAQKLSADAGLANERAEVEKIVKQLDQLKATGGGLTPNAKQSALTSIGALEVKAKQFEFAANQETDTTKKAGLQAIAESARKVAGEKRALLESTGGAAGPKKYVRTGTDAQGRRVGLTASGQVEVIPPATGQGNPTAIPNASGGTPPVAPVPNAGPPYQQ